MELLGGKADVDPEAGGEAAAAAVRSVDRRVEPRHDCTGLRLILRQRRALGIIHLRNLSHWGACGISDLPVAVGGLVFLELKKGHFYGARVKWVHCFRIGVQFARKLKPETLNRLLDAGQAEREARLRALG